MNITEIQTLIDISLGHCQWSTNYGRERFLRPVETLVSLGMIKISEDGIHLTDLGNEHLNKITLVSLKNGLDVK